MKRRFREEALKAPGSQADCYMGKGTSKDDNTAACGSRVAGMRGGIRKVVV